MKKAKKEIRLTQRKPDKLPDRTLANPPEGPSLGAKFWEKAKLVQPKPPARGSSP
jgi:hypothetical protein